MSRQRTGQLIAAVAGMEAGVFLLDLSGAPPSMPTLLTRFDWTYKAADVDDDPLTRSGGADYLATVDRNWAGHLRIWSLEEIFSTCPTPSACAGDEQCGTSQCPPGPGMDCTGAWPPVDQVPAVAYYQLAECPLWAQSVRAYGDLVFVAHAEAGVHVLDLSEADGGAGLPPMAGASPIALTALESLDTLPADTDTILENYPCHDEDASGTLGFYYIVTGERDCGLSGVGVGSEGTAGVSSLGEERPLGGGSP